MNDEENNSRGKGNDIFSEMIVVCSHKLFQSFHITHSTVLKTNSWAY